VDDYRQLRRSPGSQKGNSLIEFTFLVPWFVFLFVGSFDLGMYSYALVAVQDGVRAAAVNASQNATTAADGGTAGGFVLDSIKDLPNIGSAVSGTSSAPIVVTATLGTGPDGGNMTTITATYTSPQLIPIPGLIPGQLTIVKTAKMRVRN
jgi:Flp pilus assembly protein TadG